MIGECLRCRFGFEKNFSDSDQLFGRGCSDRTQPIIQAPYNLFPQLFFICLKRPLAYLGRTNCFNLFNSIYSLFINCYNVTASSSADATSSLAAKTSLSAVSTSALDASTFSLADQNSPYNSDQEIF